jgi:hypothetical protein
MKIREISEGTVMHRIVFFFKKEAQQDSDFLRFEE